MTIQHKWLTTIATFEEFRHQAHENPGGVYLGGERPCHPKALTLESLKELRERFVIEGPSWRAHCVRKCAGELAQEFAARRAQKRGKRSRSKIDKFRYIQLPGADRIVSRIVSL